MTPAKYDDLDYRPVYGTVDVRGQRRGFAIPVSVESGRAMEADGIPVTWIYASAPVWIAEAGLAGLWMRVQRLLGFPSRHF